jgi:putative ABC transport system permease protein
MRQLRGMASLPPAIVLAVTAFLLHVVLSRLISTQRGQIAVLKAFGYPKWAIGWHFLKLVVVLVLLGVGLGTGAGAWLSRGLTDIYMRYFRYPTLTFHLDAGIVLLALLVSAGASVLGTLGAVRRAIQLPPAEAMRPAAPSARVRPTSSRSTSTTAPNGLLRPIKFRGRSSTMLSTERAWPART